MQRDKPGGGHVFRPRPRTRTTMNGRTRGKDAAPGTYSVRGRPKAGDHPRPDTLRGTAREIAHAMLVGVLRDGRSLGADGRRRSDTDLDPRERAFARELAFGTLRYLPRLDAWLAHIAQRPPRRRDTDVRALALLGLYQLAFTRVPPHAAVNATVELARTLGKPWAAGFVNAALRRFAAGRDAIERAAPSAEARLAHPAWLLEAFEHSRPGLGESIARANLERAPMTLRVNACRTSRRRYLDVLSSAGLRAWPTRHSAQGVTLDAPRAVESVPGFGEGLVSVQDEAAQLAAGLLDAPRGSRVLDACAAPGGKTAHLLEHGAGDVEVVALDDDPRRVADLERTLARLRLGAHVRSGDATEPDAWWDGKPFDRILLDAPCSGTGVIRRHPDVKVLRRPEDLDAMADRQRAMLRALWPLLARGGRLLYATCSVLSLENESIVEGFVAEQADAAVVRIAAAWGRPAGPGRQILPGEDAMDGFFYAALAKR